MGLSFKQIGGEVATKLEDAFTMEEVFEATIDLNRDKGQCSNGFPLVFWHFN